MFTTINKLKAAALPHVARAMTPSTIFTIQTILNISIVVGLALFSNLITAKALRWIKAFDEFTGTSFYDGAVQYPPSLAHDVLISLLVTAALMPFLWNHWRYFKKSRRIQARLKAIVETHCVKFAMLDRFRVMAFAHTTSDQFLVNGYVFERGDLIAKSLVGSSGTFFGRLKTMFVRLDTTKGVHFVECGQAEGYKAEQLHAYLTGIGIPSAANH
ncbi:hypothetical protein O9X98_06590 [Agrobacterium salinitolerans]|nr:hypothetical protein [Agrobacterium salinitolerans]